MCDEGSHRRSLQADFSRVASPVASAADRCYGRPGSCTRGVVHVKRLVIVAVLFVLAVPGGAAAAPGQTTVERFPIDFAISSASCPNLSEGATIEGSGTMHSVTRTKERAGITTLANSSTATGSATDQDG